MAANGCLIVATIASIVANTWQELVSARKVAPDVCIDKDKNNQLVILNFYKFSFENNAHWFDEDSIINLVENF